MNYSLYDNANNLQTYFTDSFTDANIPNSIQVTGVSDVTPPSIVDLSFNPETIDVSNGSQMVTVSLNVTDNLSGVDWANIEFVGPSGQFNGKAFSIVSGDVNNRVYECTLNFSQYSKAGNWYVNFIRVSDVAGNVREYDANSLANVCLPNSIQVTGTLNGDVAPSLVDLSFNPEAIVLGGSPQNVTVALHAVDDLSGFEWGNIILKSPSGQITTKTFSIISGDTLDGTYVCTFEFSKYSEVGIWYVDFVRMSDNAGNYREYNADSLASAGLPNSIQVTSVSDITSPTLVDLSFNQETINVDENSPIVSVTLHITDDLSGFNSGNINVQSPSGKQLVFAFLGLPQLVSGDENDGVYQCTLEFPQYSEAGTWTISNLYLSDKTSNHVNYDSDSLEKAGIPNTIIVVPFVNVVPEVPLGTLMAVLAMFTCLVGFVVYKKFA
jgi:hypothetical protein